MQQAFSVPWIPSFNVNYFLGIDGISFPLVILTSFICMLAMGASWPINKHVKAYCMLFLLLETGMLGVFMALDFFLFYVFWEVMLLPMYFLIGIWGGPRREYAAIKFFLFTLVGGVLMLIALLMLYFASDLRQAQSGTTGRLPFDGRRAGHSRRPAASRSTPSICWPWPRSAGGRLPLQPDAAVGQVAGLVGVSAAAGGLHHPAALGAGAHLVARLRT